MGNLSISDMLNVQDQLNLNLVLLREKSGMVINLNNYDEKYDDFKLGNSLYEGFIEELESMLEVSKEAGLIYQFAEPMIRGDYEIRRVAVTTKKHDLHVLLQERLDVEKAHALGIPVEDFLLYSDRPAGIERNSQLRTAMQMGINIPSWIAYLDYAPAPFDLVNNDISVFSRSLGLRYQDSIRTKVPELAEEVENHFCNTFLPSLQS